MVNILRISSCVLIIISILCVIVGTQITGVIPIWIGLIIIGITLIIGIIMFALANILEGQQILFEEIREQNSILYRLEKK